MAQAYGLTDFDDLFVSISTLTLSRDFPFCQVELWYTWYPLDAILISDENINVLWYKEARSLKDFCHKISKTIISEFSSSNAKQMQTGNWNYRYDLHLTVFLLFLNTVKPLNSGHLRVYKNLSVIERYPLLGGNLKKIVAFGKRFVRYLWHVPYLGCPLLGGFTVQ